MTETTKHFESFTQYWSHVTFWDPGVVPRTKYQSYPVPVRRNGKIWLAYMTGRYIYIPNQFQTWPPDTISWADPVSGLSSPKDDMPVSNAYFGLTGTSDGPLTNEDKYPNITSEDANKLRTRLFELYDVLFPAWAAGALTAQQREKLQDPAREFLKTFDEVCQPGMQPYYAFLGRDWFAWLRELAK